MPGRLRMSVSTKFVNCTVSDSVPLPDEWGDWDEDARQTWIDQEWETFMQNNLDSDAVIEED